MLGDLIGQESGQTTGQRVVAGEHGLAPTVETSFAGSGTLLGVEVNDLGTYAARLRADGTLQGEGQGILMSPTGASATWQGAGVGTITESGGNSWRGSLIFTSDSPEFAALRGAVGVFEWEVDASGKAEGKFWAWK
ncbi:hypothetical protein [Kitasatospora sp. P5_F3]